MRQILFVLLVIATPQTMNFQAPFTQNWITAPDHTLVEDRDVIDEWDMRQFNGDSLYPAIGHYKAVLFFSKQSLDRYLSSHRLVNAYLIDVKNGKQFEVEQTATTKTVNEPREVITGYSVKLKEKGDGR